MDSFPDVWVVGRTEAKTGRRLDYVSISLLWWWVELSKEKLNQNSERVARDSVRQDTKREP